MANLPLLFRPVIEKKVKKEDEEAAVIVETEMLNDFDVVNGVSHGYWKDLLNILVLAVNKSLDVLDEPQKILKSKNNPQNLTAAESKAAKHKLEKQYHENALKMLQDPFYHVLHLSVARLFAQQFKKDLEVLETNSPEERRKISLAAKWAPSLEGFHDKHTIIATSIAAILYPHGTTGKEEEVKSREMYLKHAREHYRRYILSPLRKALEVVERDISAESFDKIDFAKVPSRAMSSYKELVVKKSQESFETYINEVVKEKSQFSGAMLSPDKLIEQAWETENIAEHGISTKHLLAVKTAKLLAPIVDAQWAALVKRIKDSGTLTNSVAVCDVSVSMQLPDSRDGTYPLHAAVGLSLLLAEIGEEPFGGSFISFSTDPKFESVGGLNDTRTLGDKVSHMHRSRWEVSTDFAAVFERLVLPRAIEHKLTQENMVKQIFVFTNMPFAEACGRTKPLETAYGRIKRKYADAGYEVPQLIFWNLSGHGGSGYTAAAATRRRRSRSPVGRRARRW